MCLSRYQIVLIAIALCLVSVTTGATSFQQEQNQAVNAAVVQVSLGASDYRPESGALPDGVAGPFKAGNKILFGLVMTNISPTPVKVVVGHSFRQNRPELFKEGQLVPYRAETSKLLATLEDPNTILQPRGSSRPTSVILAPNKPAVPEYIDLAQWYEPLLPGHYQLNLEHKFGIGEEPWINCSSITFDIMP